MFGDDVLLRLRIAFVCRDRFATALRCVATVLRTFVALLPLRTRFAVCVDSFYDSVCTLLRIHRTVSLPFAFPATRDRRCGRLPRC